jgi:hypothetical protein
MKNYVALCKKGFGGNFTPGMEVSVPETDADKTAVAADLKAYQKSKIRYAETVAEAKEKLLAWVRIQRLAGNREFKLVNGDTGQDIDLDIAAAQAPAAPKG